MKKISDLGVLALGPRLKRLSDSIHKQIDEVYKREKLEFNGRNFPLLQLLNENESMSITELAETLSLTHPAISQLSKKLEKNGWIYHHADESDERRRLLSITPVGFELFDQLAPIWNDLQIVLGRMMATGGGNLMANLDLLERQLDQKHLVDRMAEMRRERIINTVEITHFKKEYASKFYRLNRAWLEKYFYVEAIDHQILSEPQKFIIEPGGFILLARIKGLIVGSVALVVYNNDCLELAKIVVDEDYHGLGIGEKLISAAIQQYEATDYKTLFLESSRELVASLNLYDKVGFVETEQPKNKIPHPRSDIYMVYRKS